VVQSAAGRLPKLDKRAVNVISSQQRGAPQGTFCTYTRRLDRGGKQRLNPLTPVNPRQKIRLVQRKSLHQAWKGEGSRGRTRSALSLQQAAIEAGKRLNQHAGIGPSAQLRQGYQQLVGAHPGWQKTAMIKVNLTPKLCSAQEAIDSRIAPGGSLELSRALGTARGVEQLFHAPNPLGFRHPTRDTPAQAGREALCKA
jgi:hypothetical protein